MIVKAMIIDDEYLVRELLKNCINWTELGIRIVAESSNGLDAMSIVDEVIPDIIFTDISMPLMDGIELSEIVREKYPFIKIIILTGYDEFEYAKRSIKIGVSDFLLKPIDDEEITKVVAKVKEELVQEKKHKIEHEKIKKQLEENFPYLKQNFLNTLMYNKVYPQDILEKLRYFGIEMNNSGFQVIAIEFTPSESNGGMNQEDRFILDIRAMDIVEELHVDNKYIYTFFDNNHKIIILNCDTDSDIIDICTVIKNSFINKLNCSVCIGIGNRYKDIKYMHYSYKEACDSLKYKIIAGKNQIIKYDEINLNNKNQLIPDEEHLNNLNSYLKLGLKDKSFDLIEYIYYEVSNETDIKVDSIRVVAANIISRILNVLTELEINSNDIFMNHSQPYEQIFAIDTLPEMVDYLQLVIGRLVNIIQKLKINKVNKTIKDIKAYIEKNFDDKELSLSQVSNLFYLNPSYLSRIFKQEVGQTFKEFLVKIRMEMAIKLLRETDYKAYQIAEKIGMVNPHYFSVCFKKYVGVSVSEYKYSLDKTTKE